MLPRHSINVCFPSDRAHLSMCAYVAYNSQNKHTINLNTSRFKSEDGSDLFQQ